MRSLDEWHKYVEIQVKRANTVRSAPATPPSTGQNDVPVATEPEEREDESILADVYEDAIGRVTGYRREPEPAYLTPTPLPPQIEFAASDLPGDHHREFPVPESEPSEPEPPADRPEDHFEARHVVEEHADVVPEVEDRDEMPQTAPGLAHPARNGRSGNAAKKETREELLARLLDPELTLEEAAQVLNVCPTTVRRYTNRGILPHYRTVGNQRRFRLSQVLAFLESQESPGSASLKAGPHANGMSAAQGASRQDGTQAKP